MNRSQIHVPVMLRTLLFVMLAALIAACGSTPAATSPVPTAASSEQPTAATSEQPTAASSDTESSAGKTEVLFWHLLTNPVEAGAVDKIVSDFNAANPDVVVKAVQVPGDETDVTKLMTAVRGGTGPDVYFYNRPFVAERASTGILTDLTPYVEKDNLLDNYLPFTHQEITFRGKVYALPFDTDARVLYYNKTLLKEVGVDPAEFDPANGPISLERVEEISKLIDQTDESGAYTRVGFIPWLEQGWHYTWGYAFGGSFYDASACQVTPTNEGVVKAFQFLYDWAKRMDPAKVKAFQDSYLPQNAAPESHPFLTGRLGMMVSGDWVLSQIAQYAPDLDYGVTYIPVPKGNPVTSWSAGWSLVMPSGAKNPDAAYRFMKYMTGPEGQRVYVEQTSHLPTWKALLDEADLYDTNHQFFRDLLPQSASLPPVPVGAAYWDALSSAQEQVTQNAQEPLPALEEAAGRVQSRLQTLCSQ